MMLVAAFRDESWSAGDVAFVLVVFLAALGGAWLAISGARRGIGYIKVVRAATRSLEQEQKIDVAEICQSTGITEGLVREFVAKGQKEKAIPLGVKIEGAPREATVAALGSKCPLCGSGDVSKLPDSGPLFKYTNDRVCTNCSTMWRPACPKWVAAIIAVLSLVLALTATAFVIIGISEKVPFFIWAGGAMAIGGYSGAAFGIGCLAGVAGKLKVLQRGSGQ